VNASLSEPTWQCGRYFSLKDRLSCIKEIIGLGYCETAYKLICDLATAPHKLTPLIKMSYVVEGQTHIVLNRDSRGLLRCGDRDEAYDHEQYLIALAAWEPAATRFQKAIEFLGAQDRLLAKSCRYAVQTGKMVLSGFLRSEDVAVTDLDLQIKIFKAIAVHYKNQKDKDAIMRELLDLPTADIFALLQNPKARQLLVMIDPSIEQNAFDVFLDRLKRLENIGFTFPSLDLLGEEPIEFVADRPVDRATIDLLLDLAEAKMAP
jgi:hypothetical protein